MERIDEIGFGGLKLIQDTDGFCYGVDAVILADFTAKNANPKAFYQNVEKNVICVDLGANTGIIPLILSRKTAWGNITGVEIQKDACELAKRNAELNDLTDRLGFLNLDAKDLLSAEGDMKAALETRGIAAGTVDVITCNPPYTESLGGMISGNTPKMIARHETTASLEDFVRVSAGLLKTGGDLFMVHRPSRLADLCEYGRRYRLEPKEMRFVSPKADSAPNIILVHFVKNAGKQLTLLKPLSVYNEDGTYTDELRKAYE